MELLSAVSFSATEREICSATALKGLWRSIGRGGAAAAASGSLVSALAVISSVLLVGGLVWVLPQCERRRA